MRKDGKKTPKGSRTKKAAVRGGMADAFIKIGDIKGESSG